MISTAFKQGENRKAVSELLLGTLKENSRDGQNEHTNAKKMIHKELP